jgi:hypothetical protein
MARTQPWSQPWVERYLQNKNPSHFPTFPPTFPLSHSFSHFPNFSPLHLNAKYPSSGLTRCDRCTLRAHLCVSSLLQVLEVTPTSWLMPCHLFHTVCEVLHVLLQVVSNSRGPIKVLLARLSMRIGWCWRAGGPLPCMFFKQCAVFGGEFL